MGTAVGLTQFVLGSEADGNREMLVFEDGQDYGDLPVAAIKSYEASDNEVEFPVVA